ncbi:hypothetical protein NDI47_27170, partial [Microcoleus vaginatus GB1-A2]|uniref:hypothetical protein n=1 Tax=Microcoleus vaginatus TaxID=119532 RepID=UPI001A7E232E
GDAIIAQLFGCFYSLLSRMIHFYPLNPRMCQLGVRNVGYRSQLMQVHSRKRKLMEMLKSPDLD